MNAPYLDSEIAHGVPETPSISLRDILNFFKRRRRVILGIAAAIMVAVFIAAVVILLVAPRYTAISVVMLDQRQTRVVSDVQNADVLSALPTDESAVQNEVQILQSRAIAELVVNKMHLIDDPEFNAKRQPPGALAFLRPVRDSLSELVSEISGTPPMSAADKARAEYNATVDAFIKAVDVSAQGVSTTIEISVSSMSAKKASRLANAMADLYITNQLNMKFTATKRATDFLAGRLGALGAQATAAEAAVAAYKAQHNLADLSTLKGGSVLDQQLTDLTTQMILTRTNTAEAEARLRKMQELRASGHGADVTQVVSSPLIATLREQEATLAQQAAQLSSTFGPRHPKVLDVEAQKRVLQQKIDQEVARVGQTLQNDVDVARAREAALHGSMAQLAQMNSQQGSARVKLAELQAEADSSRAQYNSFLSRSKETRDQEGMQTADSRLVSYAEMPLKPSFPKVPMIMALALPASLMFGIFVALILEHLNSSFLTASQLQRALGIQNLSVVPELGHGPKHKFDVIGGDVSAANYVLKKPMSFYSEAVRGLQMGLSLSPEMKPTVLLVTSAVADEGKTTMAISLARQAAQSGRRVVLVDCDLRRSSVNDVMGLGPRQHWLGDYLRGDCDLESILIKDPQSPLYVIPAHSNTPDAPVLFTSARMQTLLETLRRNADLIVVDSAPMLPVNDTKHIVPLTDAVLFVVRWGKTPREAVISAYNALRALNAPAAGVVLVRTDAERFQYYNFGTHDFSSYRPYYND